MRCSVSRPTGWCWSLDTCCISQQEPARKLCASRTKPAISALASPPISCTFVRRRTAYSKAYWSERRRRRACWPHCLHWRVRRAWPKFVWEASASAAADQPPELIAHEQRTERGDEQKHH